MTPRPATVRLYVYDYFPVDRGIKTAPVAHVSIVRIPLSDRSQEW